jgi:hypothetical protein
MYEDMPMLEPKQYQQGFTPLPSLAHLVVE